MRRFTRLTNGFSKKVENHAAMVSLHFMDYNFARAHSSLGKQTTPGDGGWRGGSRLDGSRDRRPARLSQLAVFERNALSVHALDVSNDLYRVAL